MTADAIIGMTAGMRAWYFAAATLILGACGEDMLPAGVPLAHTSELNVVAHAGDDLMFISSDLAVAVLQGTGVTSVYVTAGDGEGGGDAGARYDGVRAAYAALAGNSDWSCGWIEIAGHAAEHCRLDTAQVSLVFLGYPDGSTDGSAADSLLHLWEDQVRSVATLGARSTTYDRPGLIATLTEIIDTTAPATLRTLEIASTHGDDHSDHMLVGALAVLATAASSQAPALSAYRGFNTSGEPENASQALYDRSLDALAHYEACARGCASCGQACPADQIDPMHVAWLSRSYPIGMQRTADGTLHLDTSCVVPSSSGGNLVLADCTTAPIWHLAEDGTLRTDAGLCLDIILTGEAIGGTCERSPGSRLWFDSEGHLWSGVPPAPSDNMALAHLYCLRSAGGRPRAGLCGDGSAPTWQFGDVSTPAIR